jgi:hypothetical protein
MNPSVLDAVLLIICLGSQHQKVYIASQLTASTPVKQSAWLDPPKRLTKNESVRPAHTIIPSLHIGLLVLHREIASLMLFIPV